MKRIAWRSVWSGGLLAALFAGAWAAGTEPLRAEAVATLKKIAESYRVRLSLRPVEKPENTR